MRDASIMESTVRGAASGDEVALARLIAEYHDPMVKVAYVIIGDADLAREAAQVAWTVAWRRLGSLRDPERIRPWLVAICRQRGAPARAPRAAPDGRRDLGPAGRLRRAGPCG